MGYTCNLNTCEVKGGRSSNAQSCEPAWSTYEPKRKRCCCMSAILHCDKYLRSAAQNRKVPPECMVSEGAGVVSGSVCSGLVVKQHRGMSGKGMVGRGAYLPAAPKTWPLMTYFCQLVPTSAISFIILNQSQNNSMTAPKP